VIAHIGWSTAFAVSVAAPSAMASCEHAYDLARAHSEAAGRPAWSHSMVDGLIYARSMVVLDSARRKTLIPAMARWLLGPSRGPIGVVAAAWPAVCAGRHRR
jgi:hypothetical protein